jgi:uncharacterized membrane protein
MTSTVKPFAEWCAGLVEVVGISIIVGFGLYVVMFALTRSLRRKQFDETIHQMRQQLGRGILLGLEFLVAADIIHTVAVELTVTTVGVLAIIVLIRTFLSFTMELELTGRWPWQQRAWPNGSGQKRNTSTDAG